MHSKSANININEELYLLGMELSDILKWHQQLSAFLIVPIVFINFDMLILLCV